MNKLLSVILATLMILYATVVPVFAETVNGTDATSRLAGQDYYQTSVAIAEAYNNNGDCGNVILASVNDFPDALSASILSKKLNAPILLVGTTVNASSDAFNYLYTHSSQQKGTVYIVGGKGVIGPDFETKLTSIGYSNIKRLGGKDRYETNMLIVNEVNVPQDTPVFIASGENFPDALSISSFSGLKQYPTLLVGAGYLPEQTKNYLLNEKPSAVYIAGGTSVVSQDIENQIKALVPGTMVTRLAGDDRFGTNAAVLNEFSPAPDTIYLANGDDFPDVLSGSALAAKTGNPILLVDNQLANLPPALEAYLKKLAGSGVQPTLIDLGGTDVVSDILCQRVENAFYYGGNSDTKDKPQKNDHSRISVGDGTAYYLDSSGHVWAWGAGTYGELGNGTTGSNKLNPSDTVNPIYGSNVPIEVSNLSNIVSIAAGGNTCYALDNIGHVWVWGEGDYGELGNGTKGIQLTNGKYPIYGSIVPVQVTNLSNIVSIAAGYSTGYALDRSGNVWAWGGQDINGEPTTSAVPTQVPTLMDIVSISADPQGNEAFAFDSSGHIWAWGYFGSGITAGGVHQSTSRTQPPAPIQLSNLKNTVAITYGGLGDKNNDYDSSGKVVGFPTGDQLWYVLDSSGQVWAWEFLGGQASDGIQTTPVKVSNFFNVVSIAGRGSDHSTEIKKSGYTLDSSGHVWAWGAGAYGELGNGASTENQTTPVRVLNISNIFEIAAGSRNGYALDSFGNVWTWGTNACGQLGDGTLTNSNVPVQVLGLPK
ncbi:MAG: cell wall-binding repeat-containing protein [Desulfosporosinus sp.]|nr:cell wall-binding repeat-containing protein [Desulfosporosinus sp.]